MSIARISRRLAIARDDERGVALPTVIIFMFAGVLLSLVVASTVLYSLSFSSGVKASVQSQASAEAGIAAARAGLLNGVCPDGGLYTNDDPFYEVQVYKPDGTGGWIEGCPEITDDARIVSMGDATNKGVGGNSIGDRANVEAILGSITSEVTLTASGPAIFAYSASGAGAGGRLVSLDGTNVDVMLRTGLVTCDGGFQGAANVVVKSGTFKAVGGCNLAGNVWVNGPVYIDGGAIIGGSVTGTTVEMSNGAVNGNVWADETFTSTGGGVNVGGWVSAASISIGQGSIGDAWARTGDITQTGGTIRGTVMAAGSLTASNGNLQSSVTALGDVTVSIGVASGVKTGGSFTVSNGTTAGGVSAVGKVTVTGGGITGGVQAGGDVSISNGSIQGGVTSAGTVTLNGGTINAPVNAAGLKLFGGGATFGGGTIAGPACFTEQGSLSSATTVKSITVAGADNCKAKGSGWSWSRVSLDATLTAPHGPGMPVLSASPIKPAAIVVPKWIDFGSEEEHFLSSGWPGHTVVKIGPTCTQFEIYNALTIIGTDPGVIDATACTDGIVLLGDSSEYTGPSTWSDELWRTGFTFKNDLVIISDKFTLGSSGRFTGASPESQLWLINPDTSGDGDPDCRPGEKLEISGSFTFQNLKTLLYSPCKVTIGSNTRLTGQIFAGETSIQGGAEVTYAAIGLPGYDLGTGDEANVGDDARNRPIVSQRNITG